MNHAATTRTRSLEATRANAFLIDAKAEKAFTRQAFVAITIVLLVAWFVTG